MEQIEYSRTVVPSSMRSKFWKYFGFPSDSENKILTRQKIVCTLCNTCIAYNKNTSNLRTHLMAKHTEIFQKLLAINNETEDCGENGEADDKNEIKKKRCDMPDTSTSNRNELFLTHHNLDEQYIEKPNIDLSDLEYGVFDDHIEEESERSDIHAEDVNAPFTYIDATQPSAIIGDTYVDQQQQQQQSLDIMLADMLQMDLLSLETVNGSGFRLYNQQVSGFTLEADQTLQRVKSILRQRIADTRQLINNYVHELSQISPYSLSMEFYTNGDDITILNIYFNFCNESHQLNSVLYSTTIVDNHLKIVDILKDVNLKNCIVIVVNDLENEFILEFTRFCEMDLIECLSSSITRCLRRIFKLNFVALNFQKHCDDEQDKLCTNRPPLRPRCSWSKFKHLEFVYENLDEEDLVHSAEMKLIFDYIKPLKTALEIISDEKIPLCTLSRPLIIKLFEQYFDDVKENENLTEIRSILDEELRGSMNRSTFLSEATYFDPRFRQDFTLSALPVDMLTLKTKVIQRFKHLLDSNYAPRPISTDDNTDILSANSSMSNLKTFFNRSEARTTSADDKSNLDLEFERYNSETTIDLDQNPVFWWREHATNFQELHKIVFHYLTTPCCCVQRLYMLDEEERLLKLNRRKQLNQYCDVEGNLWYLYYNDYMQTHK